MHITDRANGSAGVAEPPVKIFDVPEYEERFAIRTLMNEPIPAVLIVCGSEKAASAALGTLLFYLNIRENEIVIGEINRDSQPLTPIRGHFFANTSDSYSYFNFTLEQWRNLLDDYVLWEQYVWLDTGAFSGVVRDVPLCRTACVSLA